jgi:integral membrane protein
MDNLLRTRLGRLRIIAFLEGISFLLLLGVAMPLKYWAGWPEGVRVTGMAHGLLFMAYVPMVLHIRIAEKWSLTKTGLALVASVLPFGTFWAEARLFRKPGKKTSREVPAYAPAQKVAS